MIGRTALLCLLVSSAIVRAAEDPAQALIDRVYQTQSDAYVAVLGELDAYLEQHPEDVDAQVRKCSFVRTFAWAEDSSVERAGDDDDQCTEALQEERFAEDARVQLFLLEDEYGESAVEAGEKLLPIAESWSPKDRARLFEHLADAYRPLKPEEANFYAQRTLNNDPNSTQRLNLAEAWIENGAGAKARSLLTSTSAEAWKTLSVYRGANLLLRAGAPREAAALLQSHSETEGSPGLRLLLAEALGKSGKPALARETFAKFLDEENADWSNRGAIEYFKFELKHGTRAQAEAAYKKMRDRGYLVDPFGRYRLALTVSHPTAAWHLRDVLGLLAMWAVVAVCVLLPAVFVAPIHYRSLAKRAHGADVPPGRWGLREIWMVLAIVFTTQVLMAYVFAYDALAALISNNTFGGTGEQATAASLAHLLLFQSLAMMLCLIPFLRGVDLRALLLGRTSVMRSIAYAVAAILVTRFLASMYAVVAGKVNTAAALGDVTIQAILGLQATYGSWVALLVVAGVIPIVEETVFRGVILHGLTRYITFWWAALFQALLFAMMHESLSSMPIVFVIGLIAAWLVRKTGGLLAPIVLHGLNNAAAYGAISVASVAVNRM